MRKHIFSLLAAAMVLPIAAQMRSNSSSPDTSGTTPFVVRKAERIASSSPMRTLSAQKASPNTPTPYDVPFVEDFSSSSTLGDWYVQDVNNNDECWSWWEAGGCVRMSNFDQAECDDWLVTPPVNLGKDDVYTLSFSYRAQRAANPEKMEVTIGKSEYGTRHTVKLVDLPKITNTKMETVTIKLPIEEDGAYYVGFHCYSGTDSYYLWLDNVKIEQNGTKAGPSPVTGLSVTPGAAGAIQATVAFTTPSTTTEGSALESLSAVKIYRDDELINTFDNPAVGTALSYLDSSVAQGNHTYRVVAFNGKAEGEKAEQNVYVGVDTPLKVAALTAAETMEGVKLSWDTPAGVNGGYVGNDVVSYKIVRFDGESEDGTVIAENVKGNTFVDNGLGYDLQHYVYYAISAATATGASEITESNSLITGKPYALPFADSFGYGTLKKAPWSMVQLKSYIIDARWAIVAMGSSPVCPPTDGDDGMLGFVGYGSWTAGTSSRLATPAIDISKAKSPFVSFYLFHYDSSVTESVYNEETESYDTVTTTYDDKLKVAVSADNGEYQVIDGAEIRLDANNGGWTYYEFPLDAFKSAKKISIGLIGEAAGGGNIYVDQLLVDDKYTADIEGLTLLGSQKAEVGETKEYVATIQNNGTVSTKDYTVDLYLDDEMIESKTGQGAAIFANGGLKVIKFNFAPRLKDSGRTHKLYALVNYADDQCAANDSTNVISLVVPAMQIPQVTDLQATADGNRVNLSWSEPTVQNSVNAVTDDMESYTPFAISGIGNYTLIDNDNTDTYTVQGITGYDNAGAKMAYQVFNPSLAPIDLSTVFNQRWWPFSGDQCLVAFGAKETANDDWLISPELSGEAQTVSFYIKSVTMAYEERFRVLYSTDTKSTSDFVKVATANYYTPNSLWRRFSVKLPEGAKYFAIHCISEDAFGLMVDDITYIPKNAKKKSFDFMGYNVYRNGVKITSEPVGESEFSDAVAEQGDYCYNVTAIYDRGESSFSNDCLVELGGGDAVTDVEESAFKAFGIEGMLRIAGASDTVDVFGADGRLCLCLEGSDNYTKRVPAGIYIVRSGKNVRKVIVR